MSNAGRAFSIKIPENMFRTVERELKYRFWDKGRERSNRAANWASLGVVARYCPMKHDQLAWVGPPYDPVRAYVCLRCHAAACEPEIKDRGFEFETIPDWEISKILDLDLERQAHGAHPQPLVR